MRYLIEILKKKNLKKIAPFLVALIVAIFGVFGVAVNPEELEAIVMVCGGLLGAIIGIFANNDKEDNSGNK